jgi:hypothetical protein
MQNRGIIPDRILFADPGAEKDETYPYFDVLSQWLEQVGFPRVTIVRYVPKRFKHYPPYYTLEENCLTNGTLPSKTFGFGSCSQKWKQTPQHKYLRSDPEAIQIWSHGEKVIKAIGYDASSRDKKRRAVADHCVSTYTDDLVKFYEYRYFLQEWGWDRKRCAEEIVAAGLPVPVKSSCFFCIAMKPEEIRLLSVSKLRRIILLEARARPRLLKVEGLWRSSTRTRPGSMTEFIRREGLLPLNEIERIQRVPEELVRFQEAFKLGQDKVELSQ